MSERDAVPVAAGGEGTRTCSCCRETDDLDECGECGVPVCPDHRYACVRCRLTIGECCLTEGDYCPACAPDEGENYDH